ncbi:hypothetical protein WICPIJ_001827 [Wickerhamomyces pijperi]|uniref:Sorting nexin-3 n=1 Tax=Wickerhamomyces pijperi TaxID=599730 RepID=A0A9P8QA33_WICPI|nr:hypothetical protein WICPIJ_001827 [Wickerhamomyces pijperi]
MIKQLGKNFYLYVGSIDYAHLQFTIPDAATSTKPSIKQQSVYAAPENFLEIEVSNPQTHGLGSSQYTDYLVTCRTSIPLFRIKESRVPRRYSEFEKFKKLLELESSRVVIPSLPGKVFWGNKRFSEDVIEDRRVGLEKFLRFAAGHPLLQTGCTKLLAGFLQDELWNSNVYY